jgi:hypothetical protein
MSESHTARSAPRRTTATEPTGPFVFEAGDGFIVTVTATGHLSVKTVKNALERATRLARKAITAGITEAAPFAALLTATAEAEKLKRARKEAQDRVNQVLVERPAQAKTVEIK